MDRNAHADHSIIWNKIPQVAFAFWVIENYRDYAR
jgi:hypothetical protein